jgi:hypothetical protein
MIKRSQDFKLDLERVKLLIQAHVGQRYAKRVLEQYGNENTDLWGLYNAITYVASHDETLTPSSRELLIDNAADMLTVELR